MISLQQINNQRVRAIPLPEEDLRPIKGFDVCEEVYANIFLCARKNSGKTSALFKIVKECATKKTIIIVFCSTAYKDKNWIQIRKYFERKDMDIRIHTSIYEDGQDQLQILIEDLKREAKEKEEDEEDESEEEEMDRCDSILARLGEMHIGGLKQNEEDKKKKRKERKCKYQSPEYIIIFDDLSSELKSPSLISLMKFNRHFKSKLIISSQYLNDLKPESRKQLHLIMIFKGFAEKKIRRNLRRL